MVTTQFYRDEPPSNNAGTIVDFVNHNTVVSNKQSWYK